MRVGLGGVYNVRFAMMFTTGAMSRESSQSASRGAWGGLVIGAINPSLGRTRNLVIGQSVDR